MDFHCIPPVIFKINCSCSFPCQLSPNPHAHWLVFSRKIYLRQGFKRLCGDPTAPRTDLHSLLLILLHPSSLPSGSWCLSSLRLSMGACKGTSLAYPFCQFLISEYSALFRFLHFYWYKWKVSHLSKILFDYFYHLSHYFCPYGLKASYPPKSEISKIINRCSVFCV